jgi:hypothetical protein
MDSSVTARRRGGVAFLEKMEQMVPWGGLCRRIEPNYPKAGSGRQPVGAERMLPISFLQQWFNLSDPSGGRGAVRLGDEAAFRGHRSGSGAGAE